MTNLPMIDYIQLMVSHTYGPNAKMQMKIYDEYIPLVPQNDEKNYGPAKLEGCQSGKKENAICCRHQMGYLTCAL